MKHLCKSCDYFVQQALVDKPAPAGNGSSKIVAVAPAPAEKLAVGFCKLNQPFMQVVQQQSALDPRMVQQSMQRSWPTVAEDDYCSHHPQRVIEQARATAFWVRRLDTDNPYDPQRFPDAGFQSPPTLAQAKSVAVVAQGENVSDPLEKRS